MLAGRPRSGKKNGGRSPRVKSCDKRLKYIVVVEFFESLVTVFEVSLEHSVKFRSFVREEFGERFEADFSVKEFLRIAGRFLAVKLERILSFLSEFRIESVKRPLSCFDCEFLFVLAVRHVNTVVDARSISDDERRSVVFLCFGHSLYKLVVVCAHCNVDVAVSHGNHSEIFLSNFLSACREFRSLTELRCL